MKKHVHTGSCFCGSIRYHLHSEPRDLVICHCQSCRRASGGTHVPWGTVDVEAFRVTGGELAINDSSPEVKRGFCPHCGTNLTYQHGLRSQEIDIALVTLSDPSAFAPKAHIWTRDKLPWVQLDDGLPRYLTVADQEDQSH